MSKSTISKEEVLRLATLVQLELSDEEISKLQSQLGETIDYIKNLDELDTSDVAETSHPGSSTNITFEDGDAADRTFTPEQATSNGKNVVDNMFEVKKILDK